MMTRCARSAALALLVAALLPAAVPAATYSPWSYLDKARGLADNAVQAVVADPRGGILVGTRGGLARYDGARFETWTAADGLPGNDVASIAVDAAGRVWVGASGGVARLDGGRWERLGLPGAGDRMVVAAAPDGVVWFGHGRGLTRYDAAAGTLDPVAEVGEVPVLSLLADRAGRVWAGTAAGLRVLEDGRWGAAAGRGAPGDAPVAALLEDARGGVWCASAAGVASFDGSSWRGIPPPPGGAPVAHLAEDGEGRLWAGSAAGAGWHDGYDWTWFDASTGLPADGATALGADANGSVWIGTARGLARRDTAWEPPDAARGEGPAPRAPLLAARDGSVVAAADRGLLVLRGRDAEAFGPRERLEGRVRSLLEDGEGSLWVGTDAGLVRIGRRGVEESHQPLLRRETVELEGGVLEARTVVDCDRGHGLRGAEVAALAGDGEGGLWVGTATGLSRLRDGAWECPGPDDPLGRARVTALLADPELGLFAGTADGLWRRPRGGAWERAGGGDGFPRGPVNALLRDRAGRVWAGTDRGAARLENGAWTLLTARDGLVSDRVLALHESSDGRLWVGTAAGVSFLAGGLAGSFGPQDGLTGPRVASVAEAGGRIWLAAEEGTVVHRPDRAPPDTRLRSRPPAAIGTPFALFELAGGDLETAAAALRFSWRIDGGPWSAWSPEGLVTVSDLANGRHRFEARALDGGLNEDPTPASAEFEVNTGLFDLELVEASFGPLHAALHQFYATDTDWRSRPAGRVVVRSRYDRPLRVKVSAFLPEYMDFPTDEVVTVGPGETVAVPLRIELADRVLDLEKSGARQLRLGLEYAINGERKAAESTHPVTLLEHRSMSWEEPARIGLYATHLDEAVERFARGTALAFRETERAAIVYDNLLRAMVLFDALAAHGVRYLPDPENPYGGLVPGRPALDVVRLPRETLRQKGGDCDDLAVLYAALLQNLGIDAALVDVLDHVFVMLDTGLTRRDARQVAADPGLLHVDDRGRVWVPVEVTMVGRPFGDAWEAAARTLATRSFTVIELKEAWRTYAPLRPRAPAPDIVPPPPAAVAALVAEDVRRQEQALTSPEMRLVQERLAADPGDAAAVNALGVMLARRGYLAQAAARFARVIELAPRFAGGYGNLANVLYEQGRFREAVERYREALAIAELPEVHVELALTYCELGRFDLAREHYRRAMELAPSLAGAGGGGGGAP